MMLGDTASMVIASLWSSIANWSTPTVLFCVLNLMIATIFIASNFKSPNHHQHDNNPSQLARSPSLLDRVKSVNLSSFYTSPESHDHHQHEVQPDSTESNSVSQLSCPLSPLQRDNSTSELTRAPSLLDRVKSFKLTSRFTSDHHHHSGDTVSDVDEYSDMDPHHDFVEERNVTEKSFEISGVTPAKRSPSSLLKSRSDRRVVTSESDEEDVDRRRPATMKAAVGVRDESVDSKAEDFIKRFKQQLKLQRLDSLQRLKGMLNRGTSSA